MHDKAEGYQKTRLESSFIHDLRQKNIKNRISFLNSYFQLTNSVKSSCPNGHERSFFQLPAPFSRAEEIRNFSTAIRYVD